MAAQTELIELDEDGNVVDVSNVSTPPAMIPYIVEDENGNMIYQGLVKDTPFVHVPPVAAAVPSDFGYEQQQEAHREASQQQGC